MRDKLFHWFCDRVRALLAAENIPPHLISGFELQSAWRDGLSAESVARAFAAHARSLSF